MPGSGLPVLPNLNGFSVKKKPIFASGLMELIPGKELQIAQQAFPLWEFELTYEILRTTTNNSIQDGYFDQYFTQYEAILVPFLVSLGQANHFLFDDVSDDSRTGQVIGTGDGLTHVFRLVRNWGTGSLSLTEPIGELNQNLPFQFYVDGSPVGPGILANGESIDFGDSPPADGATITGDFSFYYKCRFIEDNTSFEEFLHDRWGNKALKFRSVKTDAVAFGAPVNQPVSGWRVYQMLMPSGYLFDSFSYGCVSLDGTTVVGTIKNAGNFQQGVYWNINPDPHSGATGGPIITGVPGNKHGLATSLWQTLGVNDVGNTFSGYCLDVSNGVFIPVYWRLNVPAPGDTTTDSDSPIIGSPGSGVKLLACDSAGQNGAGFVNSTDNGGIERACWMTLAYSPVGLSRPHTMDQLQNGKPSQVNAIAGASNFLFGYDSDASDLVQAVRWNKGDGSEVLLDVPGGNLFSAAYGCDSTADYSVGKVITAAGNILAIYWFGTSSFTVLDPLASFFTVGEARGVSSGGTGLVKCGITANASNIKRATVWLSDVPSELPLLSICDPSLDVSEAWGCNGDGNIIAGTCSLGGPTGILIPCLWRLT